jgi:hypothetical protein
MVCATTVPFTPHQRMQYHMFQSLFTRHTSAKNKIHTLRCVAGWPGEHVHLHRGHVLGLLKGRQESKRQYIIVTGCSNVSVLQGGQASMSISIVGMFGAVTGRPGIQKAIRFCACLHQFILVLQGGQASMSISIVGMFGGPAGGRSRGERRSMTVAEARPYLEEAEAERQFPAELLAKEAVSWFLFQQGFCCMS